MITLIESIGRLPIFILAGASGATLVLVYLYVRARRLEYIAALQYMQEITNRVARLYQSQTPMSSVLSMSVAMAITRTVWLEDKLGRSKGQRYVLHCAIRSKMSPAVADTVIAGLMKIPHARTPFCQMVKSMVVPAIRPTKK